MTASDKKEFLAQYEEIHDSLMRFCIVKSRGIMDPRDLANDVLLVGLENYHKLNDKKALLSYLFTTANRICMNKVRRKKFNGDYDERMVEKISDSRQTAETGVDITILYAALDQLPPLQKEAVTLFEISDLPIKEIMIIQNAKASAVKQRIKRGRAKLAELLKENEERKKAVVVTSILFTTNSFGMSNLDAYFQAVKDLPLPVSKAEAFGTISKFNMTGAAAHGTASKMGSLVLKKSILGTVIVGSVIGASFLISSSSEAREDGLVETSTTRHHSFITPDKSNTTMGTDNTISYSETLKKSESNTEKLNEQQTTAVENSDDNREEIIPVESSAPATTTTREKVEHVNGNILEGDTYPATGVDEVVIDHLGGNVTIKTWNKREIKVITNHVVETKNPEDEALIRDNLAFETEKKGSQLLISNNTCNMHNEIKLGKFNLSTVKFGNGEKVHYKKMELNYTVMMPDDINLNLKGNYNKITVPSMRKNVSGRLFECQLNMGDVGGKTDLALSYCKAKMNTINDAKIYLMESDLSFESCTKMDLTTKYATITGKEISNGSNLTLFESKLKLDKYTGVLNGNIKYSLLELAASTISRAKLQCYESKLLLPNIDQMDIKMRYCQLEGITVDVLNIELCFESTIRFDHVTTLSAPSSKYSKYSIGELGKTIEMTSFEDELTITHATTNLSGMTFNGKYTNYNITLARPANYQFDFDGNYGELDYSDLDLTIKNYEKTNERRVINGFFQGGNAYSALLKFDCFESQVKLN